MSAPCEKKENLVLITNVAKGNLVKEILKRENYLDRNRRTCKLDEDRLAIPIKPKDENSSHKELCVRHISDILKKHGNLTDLLVEISYEDVPLSKAKLLQKKRSQLAEKLETFVKENNGRWSTDLEKDVPTAWEKHGNLVLIPQKYFNSPVWTQYVPACWEIVVQHLGARRLAIKQTISSDGYRTPNVRLLLGDTGWVQHIDNGIKYTYDVTKCMFSAGNITEKLRVAGFDCSGETVLDLYAGIGYFTLPYLVHAKAAFVHACEWNPDSVEALRNNLKINNVADRCQIHAGDNRQLTDFADRVNLGLIPNSEEGWPIACRALKSSSGGILHIHSNVERKVRGKCGSVGDNSLSEVECFEETTLDDRPKNSDNEAVTESIDPEVYHNCPESEECSTAQISLTHRDFLSSHHKDDKESTYVPCSEWLTWAEQTAATIKKILKEKHPETEWCTGILHIEHVKSYAPHIDHLVLDLHCQPLKK